MSKSVLVIDTPESCCSCYLRGFTLALQYCKVESEHIKDTSVKPDWCPLKPLPEKNTIENGMTDYQCGMINGEHRQAIPKTDIRNNGHNKCCNKLAVYEDLEEQGLLVRLPCKVGDSLYCIIEGTVKKLKACSFIISGSGIIDIDLEYEDAFCCIRYIKRFGENVFLTREEAEKKLEGMKKNG